MRKNNIKTIISTALVSIMAISLIGCGSKGNEKSEETVLTNVSFPLEETATLTMLTSAPAISEQDPNKRLIFKRLEEENLYLKAELEYSKKLRAVVQARKNQQQKKK